MKPLRHRLRYVAASAALLLLGLWLGGTALWQFAQTAMFVHEAVEVPGIVVDVRQKPFETWAETLGEGNLSLPGDVSYQPWVRFTLPGGISAFRGDLPADNADYSIGQQLPIISLPDNPATARVNRWKFLWGASCLRLGAGCLLSLVGYALLRALRRRPAPAPVAPQKASSRAKVKAAPRKRKKAEGGDSPAPRRRKKAEPTGDTPPKKPRSRKKKTDAADDLLL